MKKARRILADNPGRVAVLFKTKNSDNFVGFSTNKNISPADDNFYYE
jgi:hypothetical protein